MNFNRLLISIGPGPEPLRFSIADRSFRFSQYIVSASQRLGYFASLSNSSYTGNRSITRQNRSKNFFFFFFPSRNESHRIATTNDYSNFDSSEEELRRVEEDGRRSK